MRTNHHGIGGICTFALLAFGGAAGSASAFTFTLTPLTVTTPTFAGTIHITGTVSMGAGETFLHPSVMSAHALPFTAGFTAGFNGPGNTWDPGFLAWNGTGTYTGSIFNHVIVAGNFGYAGGMPLGLYNTNPLGPGGLPGIQLFYIDPNGSTKSGFANYAVDVVPGPGGAGVLGLAGLVAARRRR